MSGGGTFVTWYGAHRAAHAGGTSAIAVVVFTDAHGPPTVTDADGDADEPVDGAVVELDPQAATDQPIPNIATIASLRIALPRPMVTGKHARSTDKVLT